MHRYGRSCELVFLLLIPVIAVLALSACGGGGGGGGPTTYSISTSGGEAGVDGGTGGFGGRVQIIKFGGTGSVEVRKSGTVNASFTHTQATPDLGSNALEITSDTTIQALVGEPTAGTPYMLPGDIFLYISDGDSIPGNETAVTGLRVASGATLTLELNNPAASGTETRLYLPNDIDNNGTITPANIDGTQRGGLDLVFRSYHGSTGSRIDTSGVVAGQNGGAIRLTTLGGDASMAINNRGDIDASGAEAPSGNGGMGGSINLDGYAFFENSGTISSIGGRGVSGNGGRGGHVRIESGTEQLYNSGDINAYGGDGSAAGGPGGLVEFESNTTGGGSGEIRNSGDINASGGESTGAIGGGPGGLIEIDAHGDLLNNATLNATGGASLDATASGGNGGYISLASSPISLIATLAGNVSIAGDIHCAGGHAETTGTGFGGQGGTVEIVLDTSGSASGATGLPAPGNQQLILYGYTDIDASGGSGNHGDMGGSVNIISEGERWDNGASAFVDDPCGDTINEADILVTGGSVAAGATTLPATGGTGGQAFLLADTDATAVNPAAEQVINSGAIDTSGGDSLALTSDPGGNAGGIGLSARHLVSNSGNLTNNGGSDLVNDDSPTTGFGHGSGMIMLQSHGGTASNSGTLTANGGNGEMLGGEAIGIILGHDQVINSAAISARGGNADSALAGSLGGAGGTVTVYDNDLPDLTGNIDCAGGTGVTAGADGSVVTP